MPKITITTEINAPIERCFDLASSIDLHVLSTTKTKEKAIAGKTYGLINLGDTVTWEATHFGIRQKLTSKITKHQRPNTFSDCQLKGPFKRFNHDHFFSEKNGTTIMVDVFDYTSPFGFIGQVFNKLILTKYMTNFLTARNFTIKDYAESEKWKTVLK